jgi:hypothetical protein
MGAFFISLQVLAAPTVWTLFKHDDFSNQQFVRLLNEDLWKHLYALKPSEMQYFVTDMDRRSPDVLVLFPSAQNLRKEKYLSDLSQSFDAQPLKTDLELYTAYQLHPEHFLWEKGTTHVTIYGPATDLKALSSALEALKADPHVLDLVIILGKTWVAEFRSIKERGDLFKKLPLTIHQHSKLNPATMKESSLMLNLGEGRNFKSSI